MLVERRKNGGPPPRHHSGTTPATTRPPPRASRLARPPPVIALSLSHRAAQWCGARARGARWPWRYAAIAAPRRHAPLRVHRVAHRAGRPRRGQGAVPLRAHDAEGRHGPELVTPRAARAPPDRRAHRGHAEPRPQRRRLDGQGQRALAQGPPPPPRGGEENLPGLGQGARGRAEDEAREAESAGLRADEGSPRGG